MKNLLYFTITLVSVAVVVDGRKPFQSSVQSEYPQHSVAGEESEPYPAQERQCEKKDSKNQCIAMKAAQDAKEAQDFQLAAAQAAARQVKIQLAEKALQAAQAAEAALNGKQAMVDQLECQLREAQIVAQQELASCMQTQANLKVALTAATQAGHLLKALTISLQISEANLANSQQAAVGTQQELAEKAALYDAARGRAECLLQELYRARQELCYIKQAACNAMMAARTAQCNAQQRRRSARNLRKTFHTFADVFQIGRPSAGYREFSGKDTSSRERNDYVRIEAAVTAKIPRVSETVEKCWAGKEWKGATAA